MSNLAFKLRYPLAHFELDVELSVAPGVTVLLGPNGAGKSSLLPVSYTHLTLPTICSV